MSLDLLATDGDLEAGEPICFTNDGWKALIDCGYFRIPHITLESGHSAIDLRIFRQVVINLFSTGYLFSLPQRQDIVRYIGRYNYLINLQ